MTRDKQRSFLGVLGVLVLALAAVFAAGPAQAAVPAAHGTSTTVTLTAPTAPQGASALRSPAATTPGISPAVSFIWVAPGGTFACDSGNLCPVVWDPTTGTWKSFYLYNCNRYYVSYWNGGGYYVDHQTGNVTSYFYGSGGNQLASFTPDWPTLHSYNWDPVYSIRNC